MDNLEILCELALALDGVVILCVSAQYIMARRLYNSFTTALNTGVNVVDIMGAEKNKSHCIVHGQVKALAPLISSLSKPYEKGVIQNITIKEHATQRFNGTWEDRKNILDSKFNVIPFEIRDNNFRITVKFPLEAHYLHLAVIEDHFEPSNSNILGLLFGIHQKGFQFTEYLLRENDFFTGFGEVIVGVNQKLELIPPRDGTKYLLTTEDPETLGIHLKSDEVYYRRLTSFWCIIGVILAGVLIHKWWKRKCEQIRRVKLLEMAARARIERQRNQPRDNNSDESFTCIVCLHNPREVVLLPCGHISMCFDCAEKCADHPCPVCRNQVASIHLIYFS